MQRDKRQCPDISTEALTAPTGERSLRLATERGTSLQPFSRIFNLLAKLAALTGSGGETTLAYRSRLTTRGLRKVGAQRIAWERDKEQGASLE